MDGQQLTYKILDYAVGTWNVILLMKTGEVKDLLLHITAYNIDLAAVQEIRWTGQQMWDAKDYTIFSSGRQKQKKGGVAFLTRNFITTLSLNSFLFYIRLQLEILELITTNLRV